MESLGIDWAAIDLRAWLADAQTFALPRLIQTAGQLLLVVGAYVIARWLLGRVERRITTRTKNEIDDLAAELVRRLVLISVFFWGLWRIAVIWDLGHLSRTIGAVWIVVLAIPISGFAAGALRIVEDRIVPKTTTRIDDTALPLLNRIVRFLVIGLGILVALQYLGIDVTPVIAGAGVVGLAVSLAAKDTLSNLIAGILLILDRPFEVGDRIELWNAPDETGSWGDVVEIGLRATKIRNPDNLIVVVPNNEIMQRDIINYTASGPHIRLRVPIGIAYDADMGQAKSLIIQAAAAVEGVEETPEPVVILRSFGESSIDLELRVWIDDARRRRAIGDEITERVKVLFDDHGIEIPYPKRDLYVRNIPEPEGDGA